MKPLSDSSRNWGEATKFDDALPEQLQNVGPEHDEDISVHLKINEPSQASPFVVRLTREGEEPKPLLDPVAQLAQSLVYDREELEDEAPLFEANSDGIMQISAQDLEDQLLERDVAFDRVVPVFNLDLPVARKEEPISALVLSVEPVDIFEELAVETLPLPAVQPTPTSPNPRLPDGQASLTGEEPTSDVVETQFNMEGVRIRFSLTRSLASFVVIAVLAVFPLLALQTFAGAAGSAGTLKDESKTALDTFLRGATSLTEKRFSSANADFAKAAEEFSKVQVSLNDLHLSVVAVVNVIPQTKRTMSSVEGLMTAGQELSQTAELLSMAGEDITAKQSIDLVTKMQLLATYIKQAEPHIDAATTALAEVDADVVPVEYQAKVTELQSKVPSIAASCKEFLVFTDALSTVLGGHGTVRYLAAFQNNTEIRPTGGFVGSFAEIDINHGVIEKMTVPGGGSYAMQGQLTKYVAAPGPVQLVKARWEFQDANWFPDFPASAKKMLWFSDYSGGPTMDGVIAVNATFVQRLLEILGPVDMPSYGVTINSENFLLETQKIVELDYDKTVNAPKAFIGDLAPILLDRLTEADMPTMLAVLNLVGQGLEEKDIQVFFSDNDLEAAMQALGWTGSIKQTSGDYLMPIDTNLGGGKTDGVIDETVDDHVIIGEDGSIVSTVTITRTHRGMKTSLFSGANNVDYFRLYVPEGSELIAGSGFNPPADSLFKIADVPLGIDDDLALHLKDLAKDGQTGTDIWTEDGKTVFGNWIQTAPGETSTITFTYKLPFTIDLSKDTGSPYSLFVQKQSGVDNRQTSVTVDAPTSLKVLWTSDNAKENLTASSNNDKDAFFAWLLSAK